MAQFVLSFLAALLPGVYMAWWGKRLLRRLDDPLFPDLYLRRASHYGGALGVSWAFLIILQSELLALFFAASLVALLAGDFPARRRIFRESWSLGAYLSHVLRFGIGFFGAWTLLAFLPALAQAAGPWAGTAAVVLGLGAVLWSVFYGDVFRWLLRAVPLDDAAWKERFAPIVERARCQPPRLYRIAAHGGGYFVNGFALPSLGRSAVTLSDDLLAALEPRETVAIFAHEIAHLEHYTRRRLLQGQLVLALLAALAAGLLLALGPESGNAAIFAWAWPAVCFVLFFRALAANRKHERESDLRALELTGDAEALCGALVKIHDAMRLPRQWDASMDSRMSHPSLAERLRAIRAKAGSGPSTLAPLVVYAAGDPSRAAVLTAERLHWLGGLPEGAGGDPTSGDPEALAAAARDVRSVAYSELTDLRLELGGPSGRRLKATDANGAVLEMALAEDDVAAVQAALSEVDVALPDAQPAITLSTMDSLLIRLLGLITLPVALLPPFSPPLALVGLTLLARPSLVGCAAAAVTAFGGLALALYRPAQEWLGPEAGAWTVQGVLGGAFLLVTAVLGWRRVREAKWALELTLAALALAAAGSLVFLGARITSAYPWMAFHLWARSGPSFALAALAAAAALALARRWPAAAGAALAAAVVLVPASAPFRTALGGDPLRAVEPWLTVEPGELPELRRRSFDVSVEDLEISPSGRRLAVATGSWTEEGEETWVTSYRVERDGGEDLSIEAFDLAFVDDDRVAALVAGDGTTFLRTVDLATGRESQIELGELTEPNLRLGEDGRWEVVSVSWKSGGSMEVVRLRGVVGEASFEVEALPVPQGGGDRYFFTFLWNGTDLPLAVGGSVNPWWLSFRSTSEIALLESGQLRSVARTSLDVTCFEPSFAADAYVCATRNADRTQLWWIEPGAEAPRALGSLRGGYTDARLTPEHLLLWQYGTPPVLVEPRRRRAWTLEGILASESAPQSLLDRFLEGESSGPWVQAVALRPGLLALALQGEDGTEVRLYRLETSSEERFLRGTAQTRRISAIMYSRADITRGREARFAP